MGPALGAVCLIAAGAVACRAACMRLACHRPLSTKLPERGGLGLDPARRARYTRRARGVGLPPCAVPTGTDPLPRPAPPTLRSRRAGPSHQPREQRAARPSGVPPGASLWGWFRPRGPLKRALRAHRVGLCPAVGQSSTRSRAIAPPLRRSRRRAVGLVPAAARTAQVWAVHIRSAADRVALAARVARGAPAWPRGRLSPADASRRPGVLFSIVLELPTAPRETAKIKVAGGPGRPDEGSIEGGGRRERGGGEQPKRAPPR